MHDMQRDTARLALHPFDIVVVGGGVHGAWIALRATQAGYRVALIEKEDFGAATSANSLKILHGGLRYLQHLDFKRMRSSIRARRAFMHIAPHLVRPLPCVMPLQAFGVRSPWLMGPALLANDTVAFDRNRGLGRDARIPMGRLLSRRQAARYVQPLANVELFGGALWWDVLADDAHRLVLEPIVQAADLGAEVANRVAATGYLRKAGKVIGVAAEDMLTGRRFEIQAEVTVNATGPSAGLLSQQCDLPIDFLPSRWLGALNLVLRRSLNSEVAVALSASSKRADRSAVLRRSTRELFFVPWRNVTMVGTDYHPVTVAYGGGIPHAPTGAVEAFISEINAVAPNAGISTVDIAKVHWGMLPCEENALDVPRKSPVLVNDAAVLGAKGLAIVIGEKLTSAPVLAEQTIRAISAGSRPRATRAFSAAKLKPIESSGVDALVEARLRSRYGPDRWQAVLAVARDRPEWLLPLVDGGEILAVEVIHALQEEMAHDIPAVLRRIGAEDAGHPGFELIERVAAIAGPQLGWSAVDTVTAVERARGFFADITWTVKV